MSEHHPEIIIIKRKGGHEAGHHGGAWKIAFADFMTAMMAFFLVLWIINATDKDTKAVIARYFNPTKLENPARARKGVHGVDTSKIVSNETAGDQTPDVLPPEGAAGKDEKAGEGKGAGAASAPSVGAPPKKDEKPKTPAAMPHAETKEAADVRPTMSETALFSDPYKSLDKIIGGKSQNDATPPGPDTGEGEANRASGGGSIDAFRDPFKPIGPGSPTDSVTMDSDAPPTPKPGERPDLLPQAGATPPPVSAEAEPAKAPPASPTIESSPAPQGSPLKPTAAPKASETKTADLLKALRDKLGPLQSTNGGPQVTVESTKDGLLVSLTDKLNFSMFAVGSAEPRAEVIKAMDAIATVLKSSSDPLVVRGHTDARPYKGGGYDNWRLSSERAQMAYYMLTRAGVPETRFERIEGHADHLLRDASHPTAAENRRIEILIRGPKS